MTGDNVYIVPGTGHQQCATCRKTRHRQAARDIASRRPNSKEGSMATITSVKATGTPTARQREYWDAVQKHGTQRDAALALDASQGSVQTGLRGYMAAMGIDGPLPGYQPARVPKADSVPPDSGADGGRLVPADFPDADELEARLAAESVAEHRFGVGESRSQSEPETPRTGHPNEAGVAEISNRLAAAHDADPLFGTIDLRMTVERLHEREDAREDAINERWVDAPLLIRASIDWLLEHGPTWTAEQAETWSKGFISAIDLTYPVDQAEAA